MVSDTTLRTVYYQPTLLASCREFQRRRVVHAVTVSPLMQELIAGLCLAGTGDEAKRLMARLLLHSLQEALFLPTELPMPQAENLRQAAQHVMAAPGRDWTLEQAARLARMSSRSFTRHFTQETGMSFRAWRQRGRIVASFDLLAAERPVKSVAHTLGFSSPAAFSAAFRSVLGCTPGEFRGRD
jgi:AraC-like DNA-binding protein